MLITHWKTEPLLTRCHFYSYHLLFYGINVLFLQPLRLVMHMYDLLYLAIRCLRTLDFVVAHPVEYTESDFAINGSLLSQIWLGMLNPYTPEAKSLTTFCVCACIYHFASLSFFVSSIKNSMKWGRRWCSLVRQLTRTRGCDNDHNDRDNESFMICRSQETTRLATTSSALTSGQ
jgi:hypothetical protein